MDFYRFLKEEDAPTMLEYGMLITLIAIVAAVGVSIFGLGVEQLFVEADDSFP